MSVASLSFISPSLSGRSQYLQRYAVLCDFPISVGW